MHSRSEHRARFFGPIKSARHRRLSFESFEERCVLAAGDLDGNFGVQGIATASFFSGNAKSENAAASALQSDGKIVVAGTGGTIRLLPSGEFDPQFGNSGRIASSLVGLVNAVAIQADGKIVLAGNSSSAAGRKIEVARLNADGTPDRTFGIGGLAKTAIPGEGAFATSVTIGIDGKILVGGLTLDLSVRKSVLVRYGIDGALDTTFDSDGIVVTSIGQYSQISSVALQPDGKIIAAGFGTLQIGYPDVDFAVMRYNSDGSLDSAFGTQGISISRLAGGNNVLSQVVVLPNGKILASGNRYPSSGAGAVVTLSRYNADGTADLTFDGDGLFLSSLSPSISMAGVYDSGLTVLPNGQIVIFGAATIGTQAVIAVARYDSNATRDLTFGVYGRTIVSIGTGIDSAADLFVQPGGEVVLVGGTQNGTLSNCAVARLDRFGQIDPSFNADGKLTYVIGSSDDQAKSVVRQSDGKYLAVGSTGNAFVLTRFRADGEVDRTFGANGAVYAPSPGFTIQSSGHCMELQSDGKIVIVGTQQAQLAVLRFNADGSNDTGFGTNGYAVLTNSNSAGYDLAIQSDGKILVVGNVMHSNTNVWRSLLVRFNTNGSLDSTFDFDGQVSTLIGGSNNAANSVALQSDGRITIGGYALGNTGTYDFAIARYYPDGSLDTSLGVDGTVLTSLSTWADNIRDIAIDSNGKIVAVGQAQNSQGSRVAGIVRYLPDGRLDPNFGTNGIAVVESVGSLAEANSVAIQADGMIVIAGTASNGYPSDAFVTSDPVLWRLDVNGIVDRTFGDGGKRVIPAAGLSSANFVTIDPDGSIVVAGVTAQAFDQDIFVARLKSTFDPLLVSFDASGNLTITDSDSTGCANAIAVKRVGSNIVVTEEVQRFETPTKGSLSGNRRTYTIPFSQITGKLRLNLARGNDYVTIDSTGGTVIPPGGIELIGAEGNDVISLYGDTSNSWTFLDVNRGTVQIGSLGSVSFSGFELASGGQGSDLFRFPATSGPINGITVRGNEGSDTIEFAAAADYAGGISLTNAILSSDVSRIMLDAPVGREIENAKLIGGSGDNRFIIDEWSGEGASASPGKVITRTISMFGGGGKDRVERSSFDYYFRLGSASAFSGLETRDSGVNGVLTLSASFNSIEEVFAYPRVGGTIDISDWYLAGAMYGGGVIYDTSVVINRNFSYATLSYNGFTSGRNQRISLTGIQHVRIMGGPSDQRLDIGEWMGDVTFDGLGGVDTLGVIRNVQQYKAVGDESGNGYLDLQTPFDSQPNSYGQRANLQGVESISISANTTTLDNTFDISQWNGYGEFFAGNGNDVIISDKSDLTFTQADANLAPTLLTQVTKAGAAAITRTIKHGSVESIRLTGGSIENRYVVSDWSGGGSVNGGGGTDLLVSRKSADQTLEAAALRFSGNSISLSSIETAVLSSADSNGRFLNAAAFTLGPVTLIGNAGSDTLIGGSQADVISGQGGNDTLVGNGGADKLYGDAGNDLLIGGNGADLVNGGAGDDLLIGGTTSYDPNKTALDAILTAWANTAASYAARITTLSATGVGPTNQYKLLKTTTVQDDAAVDTYIGGTELDWFWADQPGTETLSDRSATETVSDVA